MNSALSRRRRIGLVAGLALAGAAVFLLLRPLRQDESYHQFIDDRRMWGIPNALNVLSNAPFAVVGAMGLWFLGRKRGTNGAGGFLEGRERLPFAVFFLGAFLTSFG